MRDQYSRQYIDDDGNIIAFNQERFDNLHMGYSKFKNRPNGLGVFNFIKSHVCAHDWNWKLVLKVFNLIVAGSAWMRKEGLKSRIYKKVMMFSPDKERNTTGLVMPLTVDVNMDITKEGQKVVVPMDLVKDAIAKADYIAGMNKCLCRDAKDCKDYPHDLACLFIGKIGEQVVKNGLAKTLTQEEAYARVDRAAELGLVCQSLWVEVEQLIWGIRNDDMDKFLEICFCCPCCCVAMNLSRNASREIKDRFHPVGWTAVPIRSKCVGCGECVKFHCPQDALSMGEDGKVEIDQNHCVGCGYCKQRCAQGAIQIRQTMPMRDSIVDYFREDFSLDLKSFDKY
ncbi:MAG: 4Fe-4S dicluster domain-containing protein [Mogibacterium sp.]|nr:4Fe-4S dicluster domain-containing protein [Mogibacterium sp.]